MRCPVLECRFEGERNHVILHLENHHPQVGGAAANQISIYPFKEIRAFRGYLRTYRHRFPTNLRFIISAGDYFEDVKHAIKSILSVNTVGSREIKSQVSVLCQFLRGEVGTPLEEVCEQFINSKMKIVHNIHEFEDFVGSVLSDVNSTIDIFQEHGSGWKLRKILGSDIRIARYLASPRGRCYVTLPTKLKKKMGVVNVRNLDNQCFKWAFLSMMHYKDVKKNRNRISQYKKYECRYNFNNINFPPNMQNIKKFESQNADKKIAINIFECDNTSSNLITKRISPFVLEEKYQIIDLLLFHDIPAGQSHYMGVSNISRMHGKRNCHKKTFCYNCQNTYSKKTFPLHVTTCMNFKPQRIRMPNITETGAPVINFRAYYRKLVHEYVLYADFESIMQPEQIQTECTMFMSKHVPSGYQLFLVGREEGVVDYKIYRGQDCIESFFENVQHMGNIVSMIRREMIPMKDMTPQQIRDHFLAKVCHICDKRFREGERKAHDHDHRTGEYRGAAHVTCNASFSLKKQKLPVFIHNFKKYDLHLILGGFRYYDGKKIKVIPNNFEQYISIMCDNFILLDSMMFLSSSLDNLVQRLKQNGLPFEVTFKLLCQIFGTENAKLLARKGVYFYDYITSFEMFEETEFPAKEKFYNVLTEEHITDADYKYACTVYKRFCKNLGEYHDLYLKLDTILLACVMENFRTVAINFYELDPAHYMTLSGYTWDAALLMTDARLTKLTDVTQYEFFELGLRGGVSMINRRHVKANNKFMKNFDPTKVSSFIFPVDCNNLYGFALRQKLPVSNFEWLDSEKVNSITSKEIMSWKDDDNFGYALMVDLEYPCSLHARDNEYPLAPEKIPVSYEQLSEYQQLLLRTLDIKYNEQNKKLIPHLGPRKNYVCHYRNLKYYLRKGLILTKVHAVIKFRQESWLKLYIDFNTSQRQIAKDQFSKDLFKFLINACFGKSCENVRNRKHVSICNQLAKALKLIEKSNFKRFEILNSQLVIIEMAKKFVKLDKPIYTGWACLEISKLVMYQFHYDVIKKHYGKKAELLQTDTDSLNYYIETDNIYDDINKNEFLKNYFDFSDYPSDHCLYSDVNKKVMGKFKDEAQSEVVSEFIGLAPKMYSYVGTGLWKKAAKGVKRGVVNKTLLHKTFKRVLKRQEKLRSKMNLIRSFGHALHTISLKKVSLHAFDSKRFILRDGVKTLAHNHFLLKNMK